MWAMRASSAFSMSLFLSIGCIQALLDASHMAKMANLCPPCPLPSLSMYLMDLASSGCAIISTWMCSPHLRFSSGLIFLSRLAYGFLSKRPDAQPLHQNCVDRICSRLTSAPKSVPLSCSFAISGPVMWPQVEWKMRSTRDASWSDTAAATGHMGSAVATGHMGSVPASASPVFCSAPPEPASSWLTPP